MRAPLAVREAVLSALRHPVRSCLVLQAILWGSAAAIFPQAIYQGSREAALDRASELAVDRIIVASPEGPVLGSWEEIEDLKGAQPAVSALAGIATARVGEIHLLGTDRRMLEARNMAVGSGRSFTPDEIADGAAVCILEAGAAASLFPGRDPKQGELALEDGRVLRVVGTLEPRPASSLRSDELGYDREHALGFLVEMMFSHMGVQSADLDWLNSEQNVIVPWRLVGQPPRWLVLRAQPQDVPAVTKGIQEAFAYRGKEVSIYSNAILNLLLAPELEKLLEIARDVFLVSLLMGMIVVANVMIMSVNERRKEIAIRRCEGATTRDIVLQFLLETSAFCALGAMLGTSIGLAIAWARVSLDPATLVSWSIPWNEVLLTGTAVLLGGLLAGIAPAWRAARLDPVEVLSRA